MFIEYIVQPSGFVLVAVDAIWDLLRCIAVEVVGLTLHGTYTGIKEEKPTVNFVRFARAFGIADQVLGVVLLD